ncbi:MAG TPA: DUF481 domain-containing protein [Terracidiphilus sp.]|nr:DUF481 domain-containing protein [Terracidiphilus sp.]
MTRFIRALISVSRPTGRSALWLILCGSALCAAQSKPAAPSAAPDVLVLSNGDKLHGKFVSEVAGKVTFHTDSLGDVALTWDKIRELHTAQKFAVLNNTVKVHGKDVANQIPVGTVDMSDQAIAVHAENAAPVAPIPVKNAQYVVDEATLRKQAFHEPNFFTGWNGAATAGATIVTATQDQYTFSGGVGLVRVVPAVDWLDRRNRTSADFNGSFGKITQSGAPSEKTAIFHADAERDEYFSPRMFGLAQTAFDHNFGQSLALQSVYGGGIGWTALKSPKHELDVKATIQYESQEFLTTPGSPTSPNQNLIGSTFSASYAAHLKLLTLTQSLAYIPAYNTPRAYSADETDTLTFPTYKNFGFSVGTLDSYLNDPPLTTPPTKRNSFQFTMGLTYAIKSKY